MRFSVILNSKSMSMQQDTKLFKKKKNNSFPFSSPQIATIWNKYMPQLYTSHHIQDYCHPFVKPISLVDSQRGFLLHKEFQVQENQKGLKTSRVGK